MFYDVKSSKTKLVMLSSIMQYLKKKMDFYKCFHEVFVKNLTKKLSHLATKFQDLFEHYVSLRHHVFLYLSFMYFSISVTILFLTYQCSTCLSLYLSYW